MTASRLALASFAYLLLVALAESAAPPTSSVAKAPAATPATKTMLMTKLAPAKLALELCLVRYPVTTASPECQAYFDQGLGYFYSYVWMEAARSFETATRHDPNCAMAWWGLSRALQRYGRGDATKALLEAWKLKDHASAREQMLLKAAMHEKGQLPNGGKDEDGRKQKAIAVLDELLALHDEDEEAWYYRAQLAGGSGLFGGKASAVPFYKALLRVNPLHPGANHELVHFYENFQRPALGWVYAENYIASSPGQPHAFHMQAHLATRLGRWSKTSDRSSRAIELQREYHRRENVKPREDHQYSHHLETLLVSLTHDGRFSEARAIKKECEACGFQLRNPFFRLLLAERDYEGALKLVRDGRSRSSGRASKGRVRPFAGARSEKAQASYQTALVYLKQGDAARALPELEVLQYAYRDNKNDKGLEQNLWEVQGLYLCLTGAPAAGVKLLQKTVDKTKNNYGHHAWGNGAYFMEAWGIGALAGNKLDVAEEAFHEALAHDPGSVRAALGMQVLCERQGRTEEALRYSTLARRCWAKADPGYLQVELAALRGEKVTRPDATKSARR